MIYDRGAFFNPGKLVFLTAAMLVAIGILAATVGCQASQVVAPAGTAAEATLRAGLQAAFWF